MSSSPADRGGAAGRAGRELAAPDGVVHQDRPVRLEARIRLVEGAIPMVGRSGGGFAWWHGGRGLVAEGVAMRVPVAGVRQALAAIEVDRAERVPPAPHTSPVAVGALPFDPAAMSAAEMIIPARYWTRDKEGRTWLTEISGPASPASKGPGAGRTSDPGRPRDAPAPGAATVESFRPLPSGWWAGAVGEAISRIDAAELDKVVLARQVMLTAEREVCLDEVVARLVATQPGCYVFAADGFVGATPELLVARRGDRVTSRPMAGTVPRANPGALSWLAGSPKNRWEHNLVVDAVVTGLARWCRPPPQALEPTVEPFADLAHLATEVVGRLCSPPPSALELAVALHPTPAVAGVPVDAALALIAALEEAPRGRYGGPVGWVDANGDGEFAVALRCAEVLADRAVLYAGAGIVAGSKWQEEWDETEAKLEPMRRALAGR